MRTLYSFVILTLLSSAGLQWTNSASAQEAASGYPSRSIRIITSLGAGSPPDVVTRAIADALSRTFNQPVVVENRSGAHGTLAAEACARAAPDGYTLCLTGVSNLSINPFIYRKLPYDPERDFAHVIRVAALTSAISVHPSLRVNSLSELAHEGRVRAGLINWGSWGLGSVSHLYLAWFQSVTGASFTHVPYRTVGQAMTALLTGEIQVMVNTPRQAEPFVEQRKMRVLGIIGQSQERTAVLPDVPTLREAGYQQPFTSWFGFSAPAGTPRSIIGRLNMEIQRLLNSRDFVEKHMSPAACEPIGGSPEDFDAYARADRANIEQVVKAANIQPE